ncbi:MAG TPA: 16S rRNA (cytidine(1402)-2'-O)-methyltransferase [Streptosporangiaceae bacterium]|nr:16S rRNA (cytidine(1402)-2'-O)-methyltransferase [Streptosporangiaceae bacterium]
MTGRLTLVGTPIGNLGDVSDRARRALAAADVICAEDTRRTRKLLTAYDIHPPLLVSVRQHNEQRQAARVLQWLAEGRAVAYVTDAGMPVLSDPGERLVRAVLAADGAVGVAAGPDAATSALLLSGLPAARWCFEGFLPVKGRNRRQRIAALASEPRTAVLFEAPHRLLRTLAELATVVGADREVAVANDLSKRHERVWRGPIGAVLAQLQGSEPRGEFVVVLAGVSAAARPQTS